MNDVILSYGECVSSIDMFWWFIIFLSTLFWVFRFIRFCYHAVQFYDIKKFFNNALKIDDVSIDFHLGPMAGTNFFLFFYIYFPAE